MGAPTFTEAELRRTMKVAQEFGASVEICPRRGTLRILGIGETLPIPSPGDPDEDERKCDEAFGL